MGADLSRPQWGENDPLRLSETAIDRGDLRGAASAAKMAGALRAEPSTAWSKHCGSLTG